MDQEKKSHELGDLDEEQGDAQGDMALDGDRLSELLATIGGDPFARFSSYGGVSPEGRGRGEGRAARPSDNPLAGALRPSNDLSFGRIAPDGDGESGVEGVLQGGDGRGYGRGSFAYSESDFSRLRKDYSEDPSAGGGEAALDDALFSASERDGSSSQDCVEGSGVGYGLSEGGGRRRGAARRFVLFGFPLVFLCFAASGAVLFYLSDMGRSERAGGAPLIKAIAEPIKTEPEEPGGVEIPNRNRLIYDRVSGKASKVQERIVPREEKLVAAPRRVRAGGSGEEPVSTASIVHFNVKDPNAPGFSRGSPPRSKAASARGDAPAKKKEPFSRTSGVGVQSSGSGELKARAVSPVPRRVYAVSVGREALSPRGAGVADTAVRPAVNAPVPALRPAGIGPSFSATPYRALEASGGGRPGLMFAVQLAARRNEGAALAAYREMQGRYPSLRGYSPLVQKVDLGTRGVYYRLRLGPLASRQEAEQFCSALRGEGLSDCLVRRFEGRER